MASDEAKRRRTPSNGLIGGGAPLHIDTDIDTDRDEGRVTVRAVGELDRETAPRLAAVLVEVTRTFAHVDLDLSGVRFMDSQGLRVLVEARFAADQGASIVVVDASTQVRQILELTGLTATFGPEGRLDE